MRDDAQIKQARHSLVEKTSRSLSKAVKSRSFLISVGIIGLIMIIVIGLVVSPRLDGAETGELPHFVSYHRILSEGILTLHYPDGWAVDDTTNEFLLYFFTPEDYHQRLVDNPLMVGAFGSISVFDRSDFDEQLLASFTLEDIFDRYYENFSSGDGILGEPEYFSVNGRDGILVYGTFISPIDSVESVLIFFGMNIGNAIIVGNLSSPHDAVDRNENFLISMLGAVEYDDSIGAVEAFDPNILIDEATLDAVMSEAVIDSRVTDIEMTNAQVATYIARTEASELGTNATVTPSASDNS